MTGLASGGRGCVAGGCCVGGGFLRATLMTE